ncbi:MFS transporter [Sediminivirga luteola]|uniref:MFS transporter n=1 Tax=Sediminivirga luteola TaxID=1774748 RepID=UPI001F5A5460|nr:MFS transporter [Sediminivirga luteola]MCI2265245.1 MHS family MFS transporter [Sediminivirga luteola]
MSTQPAPVHDTAKARKAGLAAFVGTTIEWFDFYIYATAAALVFGHVFFPEADRLVGIAAAFGTYAVGFFFRPLGGILFGHIGDRFGRRPALVMTLVLMGGATFMVGLLPTYAQIGAWAAVLLVALRALQGIAVGGEWGGAVLMSVEHAPEKSKTFYGGFPQLGNPAGALLATGSFSLISLGGDDFLLDWGWRIPFIASIVLIAIGFWIRYRVEESPVFEDDAKTAAGTGAKTVAGAGEKAASKTSEEVPVMFALRRNWLPILIGMGAIPVATGGYYLTTTFAQAYATGPEVGVPTTLILNAMTLASFLELLATLPMAALGDKIGRRRTINLGVISTGILIAPLFLSFSTGNAVLIFVLVCAVRLTMSATYAPTATFMSQLFVPRARYTSVSLSYGIGVAIYGGLAPVTATFLYDATGTIWAVVVLFLVFAALNVACVALAPQLRDDEPAEAAR